MDIKYNIATLECVPEIKKLTDKMLAHTKLGLATEKKIKQLIESPMTLFLLATHNDIIIGYIAGVIHETMFNDTKRVSDIGIYIDPKYRDYRIASNLIHYLEQWALQKNAKQIWLGQSTGDNPEKTLKFYEHLGYELRGFNTMKEL